MENKAELLNRETTEVLQSPEKENEVNNEVDRIIQTYGKAPEALIPILQAVQAKYNYLPKPILHSIARRTNISPASITSVSTFYSQFRHKPAGEHFIKVCIGTACHVKGGQNVFEAFKQLLGIGKTEDTDKDRIFTVEKVACLGCCMLAPAVQIDDITYGPVEPNTVGNVVSDFLRSKEQVLPKKNLQKKTNTAATIHLCCCSSCVASGSKEIYNEIEHILHQYSLPAKLKPVGCTGVSFQAPLIEIYIENGNIFRYGKVQEENVKNILLHHFKPRKIRKKIQASISHLLENILTNETWKPIRYITDDYNEYICSQKCIATEYGGKLAPLNLEDYIQHGGFEALKTVLHSPREETQEIIEKSGLRGRGGAGFPTAKKWKSVIQSLSDEKYIICNGDEGDPGAFMDRMILESFPFRVIEGILIAAYTTQIRKGYLYIRAEYPLAIERIEKAIEICYDHKLLGENILDSTWSLDLKVVQGAGAFVCGEETALISAIEGQRGNPVYRPPFPTQKGLWGKPTLVNNVETYSLVPWIIRHGAEKFASLGTQSSSGTKSFALAGKIRYGGLIEVPMGITLREVVEDIGGGVENGKKLKAIQIGGPSGGCVPAKLADTQIDYEHLLEIGAMMGSGGMVVLDEDDCMVDIAHYFLSFTQVESCGKCTYCRVGTKHMLDILERICNGQGKKGDIEELEEMAEYIIKGSLCGLGKTAPNPVLSTIKYFRSEYEAHINGVCPAKKCKNLITYVVNDNCIGCTICSRQCPVEAIPFTPYEKHEIDTEICTCCNACKTVCPCDAIEVRS